MTQWHEHSDESLIDYAASHLDHAAPASMEMQRRLMVAIKHLDDESARHSTTMLRLTRATIGMTCAIGLIAVLQLWVTVRPATAPLGTTGRDPITPEVAVPQRQAEEHAVDVPGRTIRLPASRWKPMQNEFEWAVNFEDANKGARQEVARVVTIYKLPMSDDRRVGLKISSDEYLELFVVRPGTVTAQIRADKGRYWVLSRETFVAQTSTASALPVGTSLNGQRFGIVRAEFQPQIDSTRYLLQSSF